MIQKLTVFIFHSLRSYFLKSFLSGVTSMLTYKFFLCFFLISIPAASLFSQNTTIQKTDSSGIYKLSEVVVTANKYPTPSYEVANSISVIDSQDIADKNYINVIDLLNDVPGISITQQGGQGELAYVYTRGANSDYTLVLIDGTEANMTNDPSNTYDFSNLSTDNVQRVEVLRGPQSTLYGSNALAGVINIITKKGHGKPKLSLYSEGGTYNTYKAGGSLNGSVNSFNYSLSLSKFRTNGFSAAAAKYGNTEKDGSTNYYLTSRFGFDVTENINFNIFYRYNKSNTDLDQFGGQYGDDPTYVQHINEFALRTEANITTLEKLLDSKLSFSVFRNVRKYSFDSTLYNPAGSKSFYDGKRYDFEFQNKFNFSETYNLLAGFESNKETAGSEYYYFSSSFPYSSVLPSSSVTTNGVYLENQFDVQNKFFANVGARYDNNKLFNSKITYRIAPAFLIWQTGTKLKATFGTGFKAPSLYDLFDPYYGNKDLKPEESTGWDAGVEQFFINGNIGFGITYFSNEFKNLFASDPNDNYKTININKAVTNGIELEFHASLFENLSLNTNYTYTNTNDESPGSADENKPLLRRPKNQYSLDINYAPINKLSSDLDVTYVGERDDKDFSAYPTIRVALAPYTLVNLSVNYSLTDYIKIFGRIENLLNEDYEQVYGFASPAFSIYGGFNLDLTNLF
jgi:vitamin B12 transporter